MTKKRKPLKIVISKQVTKKMATLPAKDQKKLVERFFKPHEAKDGKFGGDVSYHLGKKGAPVLDDAIAHLECKVSQIVPGGDHDIVIADIVESEIKNDADNLVMKDTGWHYGG